MQRRISSQLCATTTISSEVESRLKKLSRTVKADGFRPGKVPMSVVAQRYGYSVQYEVVNDRVGQAFNDATNEAKLRVAGAPTSLLDALGRFGHHLGLDRPGEAGARYGA